VVPILEREHIPEYDNLFRLLVETMLEGVVIVDWDTTILFANKVAATMLGFDSVEEFIGHKSLEFVHPNSKELLLKNVAAIKGGESRVNNEYRFTTRKGGDVWFETCGTRIEFDGRSADLVTFSDITEKKQVTEALTYRLHFEELIAALSTDFINLPSDKIDEGIHQALENIGKFCGADRSYVILLDNGKINTTYEWCADSIASQKEQFQGLDITSLAWGIDQLKKGVLQIPCVADLPEKAHSDKKVLEAGRVQSLVSVPIFVGGVFFGFCGLAVLQEKVWSADTVAMLKMVAEIFANALERNRSEEALRVSEEEFRLAFENAKDAIFWADPETGLIIRCNRAAETLLEKKRKDIIGHHQTEVHPPEETVYYAHVFKNHVTLKEVDNVEAEIITVSGKRVPVYISASFTRVGGKPILQGIFRDITNRKQAENKIKASLKEKEVLLKEIHHRVKNNMQVISSLLSLQSAYITDQSLLDMFKDTQNRIQSMALVHENLYHSETFAEIDFKAYINVLVDDILRSYKADRKTITLIIDAKESLLDMDTAVPCGLIINELVSNAVKHAFPDGEGEITITLSVDGEHVQLGVADNGVGIPEEIDFKNTESLGLQLVTILAEEQLEGSIQLTREKGTAFCIQFTI
jgi:PAS domain S-box-containing protein